MKSDDIVFDDDLEFYIDFPSTGEEVCIAISDGLDASEEVLSVSYKEKISDFINNSDQWYGKAMHAAKKKALSESFDSFSDDDITLMCIYVLFEQNEKELYGLSFHFNFEGEHGCGIKLNTNDFQILEVGDADVAFS